MTRLLRIVTLLVAVLALVGATGCGGSNKDENAYVDQLNKVQTDFANSIQKAQSATPTGASAKEQAQTTFTSLDTAINKLIGDLQDVKPPAKVADLHNELIGEMKQFQGQVKKAADSLSSGDPKTIVAAQAQFATQASALGTKIGQTIDGINKKLQE